MPLNNSKRKFSRHPNGQHNPNISGGVKPRNTNVSGGVKPRNTDVSGVAWFYSPRNVNACNIDMCGGKSIGLLGTLAQSLDGSITDETHYKPSTDGEICDHMIEKNKQFAGK